MILSTQPRKSIIVKTIIKRGVQAAAGVFFKVGANVKLNGEFVRLLAGNGLQNPLKLEFGQTQQSEPRSVRSVAFVQTPVK